LLLIVNHHNRMREGVALRAMFEARKQVFIDLLGWDLPALAGQFEVDQFDNAGATYLILTDAERRHLASARLLPTEEPGILTSLFSGLCDEAPPSGQDVLEITRFCLSRNLRARERRIARNMLVTAIARFGLENGVRTYTGVAEVAWLQQILAFGWTCAPLGAPSGHAGTALGALRIEIEPDTLDKLAAAGVFCEPRAARASQAA
jgi:acyl-homoserine lactone synthase